MEVNPFRGFRQFLAMAKDFPKAVTPAKAGVQICAKNWIPAFAGMTKN